MAPTTLSAGDIAIIGYNFDDPDQFAFVLLRDIGAGTEITFTDNGWLSAGSFRSGEGSVTWTAETDLAAGTVVFPGVGSMLFSTAGDQILAYQGPASTPTFIYALNSDGLTWAADATSSNTSALPAGLVTGETAVAIPEVDNAVYTGPTSGTRAELLAAISNPANWATNDSVRQTISATSFDVDSFGGESPGITVLESGGTTSVAEGGPAGDTYTIALDTTPTSPVTIQIETDGQTLVSADGVTFLPSVQVTLSNTTPQTISVLAVDDEDVENSPHTGAINHTVTSNDTSYNGISVAPVNVSITDNDVAVQITKIHDIQGNATTQQVGGAHNDVSPLSGQRVTIEGVVVADFQLTSQLRGFFIQEETADQDGNGSTSEGIFVFTGNNAPLDVKEGQVVRVTGNVSEFFGMTQVSATTTGSLQIIDAGNNLSLVTPTVIDLPDTGDVDDYYEQFEGMRVQFSDKLVVSEYFELARYGQIVLTEGDRPFQYTHLDDTPTVEEYNAFLDNLERRRIILDDDDNTQNSPLPNGTFYYPQTGGFGTGTQGANYFRGGDSITNLTGVLHWSFAGQSGTDAWRIRPTEANPVQFEVENPRPVTPPSVGGNIKVANFNVLNYFTTIDTVGGNNSPRGADSVDEFERQNEKLIEALSKIDADVFGLVEIENNGGTAIQELVNRLNAKVGAGTYSYIDTGVVGTDQITVAIIYRTAVLQPKGAAAILTDPAFTDPNNTGRQRNRPAIAQTFEVIDPNNPDFGGAFNVVVNHLKSKGPGEAAGEDLDQNDGQGAWNDTRTKAADYLVNTWIPSDPTGQGDADFLIIGDLNAYRGETPITTIKNAGYTDLVERFGGDRAYSYVFDGQLGYLDHALANGSMFGQVTGVAEWHINADEVPVFDYNNTRDDGAGEASFEAKPTGNNLYEPNAFRTSDHDPVIIGLDLITNRAPVAQDDRATANQSRPKTILAADLLANDSDADGDTLRIIEVGTASSGTVALNAEGNLIYTPNSNFSGEATFTYTISDGNNGTALATVSVAVGVTRSGGNGRDTLEGTPGDDDLNGNNGADTLIGGGGADTLVGGNGPDLLNGGTGNDLLTGGNGPDTFVLAQGEGVDTITDFATNSDRIQLAGGLTFGQLAIAQGTGATSNDTVIQIGNSHEVLAILAGVTASSLSSSNFIAA